MTSCFEKLCVSFSHDPSISEIPLLSVVCEHFVYHCYSSKSEYRSNACLGIKAIYNSALNHKWLWSFELRFIKGLLFALKCTSLRSHPGSSEDFSNSIKDILRKGLLSVDKSEGDNRKRHYYTNILLSFFVSELTCHDLKTIACIHECLSIFSEISGQSIYELLITYKDRIISPILAKPLRALPALLQIGYISSIDYCMSLPSPILDAFNEELLRFLHEVVALSDFEDATFFSNGRVFLSKNFETSLTLKVVSLNLLATFLTFPDFQQAQLQQVRNHIVSLFFKSLYSKNQQVVDVARRSLQKVILFQHKLPKDLMQSGLRPVLTNLTDPKRLTVHGLEGLCRLLQLLTSYFKPEIGRKMLEHIASWSDPHVFSMACEKSLFDFNEINIIIRLVEVFPLLPNSAAVFIPDLTKSILGIEKQIKRTVSSPFRYPLAKFMSQNPTQTVLFIDENLSNFEFLQLLGDILQFPVTDVLKEHLFSENFFVKLDAILRKGPESNFPIFRIMYALFDFSLRSEHGVTKKQLLLEYFQSLLSFHLSSAQDHSANQGIFDYLLQDIIFMILGSDFTFDLVINVLLIFFRRVSIDGFCPNTLLLCIRKWINALDDNSLSSIFLKWSDSVVDLSR